MARIRPQPTPSIDLAPLQQGIEGCQGAINSLALALSDVAAKVDALTAPVGTITPELQLLRNDVMPVTAELQLLRLDIAAVVDRLDRLEPTAPDGPNLLVSDRLEAIVPIGPFAMSDAEKATITTLTGRAIEKAKAQ